MRLQVSFYIYIQVMKYFPLSTLNSYDKIGDLHSYVNILSSVYPFVTLNTFPFKQHIFSGFY